MSAALAIAPIPLIPAQAGIHAGGDRQTPIAISVTVTETIEVYQNMR